MGLRRISHFYKQMLLIREVEEHIVRVYFTDVVKSPVHLSIGQESIAVGVCAPLEKTDFVSNSYRCHATYLAKGGDLNAMMAELYGKKNGCAAGRAGSMHLIDINHGVLGASAVVGTTIPVAAGYALALKREKEKTGYQRVIVAVFGDGATEEGCFHETINFAAIHRLPIIFVCENNGLAIHAPLSKRWATEKLCERVATYGVPTAKIEDGDVFKIDEQLGAWVRDMRAGNMGAAFLECKTYRWMEHVGPLDDHNQTYRDTKEYTHWKKIDQVSRLRALLDERTAQQIETDVQQAIQTAVRFAEQGTFPTTQEDLLAHAYAG